ncbi:MAG TPA: hypothetical protein VKT76_18690 [Bradyrhizobium sp.]|nr:hypothetical protein [Bradyrhizobium sp.]
MRCRADATKAELVCVDPARVGEIWPHVEATLRAACRRTSLNAFAELEADILSGRSLVWIAWSGSAIEAAAATALINSDIGKVCVITLCAGRGMQRWLKLIERIEAYAKDEGCARIRIFGRKGWLRVLEGFNARQVVMDKELGSPRAA